MEQQKIIAENDDKFFDDLEQMLDENLSKKGILAVFAWISTGVKLSAFIIAYIAKRKELKDGKIY